MKLNQYVKAIVAALVSGVMAWGTAMSDGEITSTEWSAVVIAFLVGLGAVWAAPTNAPQTADVKVYDPQHD